MILTNFLVGLPMTLLCLAIQVLVANWCVQYYTSRTSKLTGHFFSSVQPILVTMLAMMVGNFLQVILWGVLFVFLGEFTEYYEAIYHSCVNFASLGDGDIVMSKAWNLLGPIEALNGVRMLSMTSAALMAILQHMVRVQFGHLVDAAKK